MQCLITLLLTLYEGTKVLKEPDGGSLLVLVPFSEHIHGAEWKWVCTDMLIFYYIKSYMDKKLILHVVVDRGLWCEWIQLNPGFLPKLISPIVNKIDLPAFNDNEPAECFLLCLPLVVSSSEITSHIMYVLMVL